MWSENELKIKSNIENSALNALENKLRKWWEVQENEKRKNPDYKITPFFVWKKKNS